MPTRDHPSTKTFLVLKPDHANRTIWRQKEVSRSLSWRMEYYPKLGGYSEDNDSFHETNHWCRWVHCRIRIQREREKNLMIFNIEQIKWIGPLRFPKKQDGAKWRDDETEELPRIEPRTMVRVKTDIHWWNYRAMAFKSDMKWHIKWWRCPKP